MEEEKGRNNKGISPAAILFTAETSHVIPAHYVIKVADRLCPIQNINKNGHRNRREDSTPKFFIRSFINGNANSFYLTLQTRSLLCNDSFRLHRQTKPEIHHFP